MTLGTGANSVTMSADGTDTFMVVGKTGFSQFDQSTAGIILGNDGGTTKFEVVGDTSNYISFNGASFDIKSEDFDLSATTVSMSSADSGKIMMGTNIPSSSGQDGIWLSGSGHFSFQSSSAAWIRSDQDGFAMNFPSFSVDTAGRMSATDGTFKGHLEAQTGFFGS